MFGALGRRLVAYVVLIALALLALKLLAGVVIGLVSTVVTMLMVVGLVLGALWAYRRLS